MSVQAPAAVVLIRPLHFAPNPETAADNAFQTADPTRSPVEIAAAAHEEVTRAADRLAAAGVAVHLFDDEDPTRNDSVFPNNWFSTHAGGRVAVYPMYAPNRRTERRADVVEMLKSQYRVQEVVDYSGLEHDGAYLEGTGAMVLDHVTRWTTGRARASTSRRLRSRKPGRWRSTARPSSNRAFGCTAAKR